LLRSMLGAPLHLVQFPQSKLYFPLSVATEDDRNSRKVPS
jgi:hypothetical protein